MKLDHDGDPDAELRVERENSNRLAAALELLVRSLDRDSGTLHIVVGYPKAENQLTVGHVVDGAFAMHDKVSAARSEL